MVGRQRGVLVLGRSLKALVVVNLEGALSVPALVTFNPYQMQRKKGTWLFILMLYDSPINM